MRRKELICSWLKPLIIPTSPASFTLALRVYHRGAAASGHEFTENPVGVRPSALVRRSQIADTGVKRDKLLSPFKGRGRIRKRDKGWSPLFHRTGRNENLCRYQGGCLYSGVSIATVSMCPFYRPAGLLLCNMWKKNTKMSETIWSLVISRIQTSLSKVLYCTAQAEHWQASLKFKRTWHHGFPKKQRGKNDLTGSSEKGMMRTKCPDFGFVCADQG